MNLKIRLLVGNIPKEYIPAVEAGIREATMNGVHWQDIRFKMLK